MSFSRPKHALLLTAAGVFILSGCWLGYLQIRDHLAARALPVVAPAQPEAVDSPETLAAADAPDALLQAALADPDAFDSLIAAPAAQRGAIASSPPAAPPIVEAASSRLPEPPPNEAVPATSEPPPPDQVDRIVASYASLRTPEARDPDSAYNTAQRERMAANILARAEAHRARRAAETEREDPE